MSRETTDPATTSPSSSVTGATLIDTSRTDPLRVVRLVAYGQVTFPLAQLAEYVLLLLPLLVGDQQGDVATDDLLRRVPVLRRGARAPGRDDPGGVLQVHRVGAVLDDGREPRLRDLRGLALRDVLDLEEDVDGLAESVPDQRQLEGDGDVLAPAVPIRRLVAE